MNFVYSHLLDVNFQKRPSTIFSFFWIFAVLFVSCQATLIVNENNTLQGTYPTVQIFFQGLDYPFPNVTGMMTLEENPDNSSNPYIAGNIVLTHLHLPPEPTLRKFQSLGAIAVVMQGYFQTPGYIQFACDNGNTSDIVIPVVELPNTYYTNQFVPYFKSNPFLQVTLTSEGINQWAELFKNDWTFVFQISLEVFSLGCLLLAIVKWAKFYECNGGFKLNIAQVCFALTILAMLFQIVANLDPIGMRRLFNRATGLFFRFMVTPFVVSAYFLLCLYWHDSLNSQSLKINPFSKKLIITFLITAIGYFCLYLLFVLFRIFDVGLGINPDPVEVTALVLLSGILVALSVFYIVTGIRILKRIAKSTKLVGQSKKRTKTATIVLITGSVMLLLLTLQTATYYFTIQTPAGGVVTAWFYSALQSAAALCLLLFFVAPYQRSSSTSGSHNNSKERSAMSSHSSSKPTSPVTQTPVETNTE